MNPLLTRRTLLAGAGVASAASAAATAPEVDRAAVAAHDQGVENYLKLQITDPANRHVGGFPDATGLHYAGTGAGLLDAYITAFVQPASKYYRSKLLAERMRLAAAYLRGKQLANGNFNLLITNFNSPPDTAFITRALASAARHARLAGEGEFFGLMEPVLKKCGVALAAGGIHTPNHRWVTCAALAQLHELFPEPAYLRRIDQWLAEGIDLDPDGQFSERSTAGYNGICVNAFTTLALKLNRPALLEPVRKNLHSLLYLLHPGNDVITEISRRQDQYTRQKAHTSWFALRYLAVKDQNPHWAALASELPASLSALMEYPELNQAGPAPAAPPDDYDYLAPSGSYAHIRRRARSVVLMLGGYDRFLTIRNGNCIVPAVRFASAFFGKAQFVPERGTKQDGAYVMTQSLEGAYFQPLDPLYKFAPDTQAWGATRKDRRRTEICELRQTATVRETAKGIALRVVAGGTDEVPVAVEISLAEGVTFEGCTVAPQAEQAWILEQGYTTLRAGADSIRVGPGLARHRYTQVRGARPRLPGRAIYLCGYTPFDHTIEFEM